MSTSNESIEIEPLPSENELKKEQSADVKTMAQSIVENQSANQSGMERAARDRINSHTDLYRSLVRALKRRRGFGVLFLQCTPAKGQEIFLQLQTDLPQKQIGRLTLTEQIENLKVLIETRADLDTLNVLFIEGIEHSLSPYIESEIGHNDYYKLEVLPPILDHLNLHRENFRNQFRHLCLVFVVPPFALKYFMYRAVDFFSWHSGIWTFSPPEEELTKETVIVLDVRYSEYLALSDKERVEKILNLRDLTDQKNQPDEKRSLLLIELAWVLCAAQDFESALGCCEEAISLQSDNEDAWYAKGVALSALGRNEEAILAYDATLSIKANYHEAYYNKGGDLFDIGREEEAIAAYDAALAIKPDYHKAHSNKGNALSALGRTEEAIAVYNVALAIESDDYETHNNKGNALSALGRTEEALAVYDVAIKIASDYHEAYYNKGCGLSDLGRHKEAIAAYDTALSIRPDYHEAYYNKACSYALSLQLDNAVTFLEKAIILDGINKYIETAKTDSDFDAIRDRPEFQSLIAQYEQKQHSEERSLEP